MLNTILRQSWRRSRSPRPPRAAGTRHDLQITSRVVVRCLKCGERRHEWDTSAVPAVEAAGREDLGPPPDGVGTARPPPLPTGRAPSSPLPSGSPATRRPCAETWRSTDGHPLSRTVALGRAPPSEVPGARISRRSSSVSWSSITRVVAASRRGRSTTGGTCRPVEVRNVPPAGVLEPERAEPSFVVDQSQNVDRLQRSRLAPLGLSPPPFVAPQEHLSPAVGRGVGEGVEQGPVGMERPGRAGGRTGSIPKASRRANHDRSYSKEVVCLAPRARAQSVPTGTVSPSSSMKTRISRSMSGTRGSWPYRTDTPRQPFFFQAQPDRVPGGVHHVTEPIRHPQHEEHRGVDAHRHAGITLLHPHERGAADEGAFGHEGNRYPSSPSSRGQIHA